MKYLRQYPSSLMGMVFSLISLWILYDLWVLGFIAMLPGFAVRAFIILITPEILSEVRGPLTLLLLCFSAGYIIYYWLRQLKVYAQKKETFGFLRSFLGMFGLFCIIHNVLFFGYWVYWDLTIDEDEAILALGRTWRYGIPFFVLFGLMCDFIYWNIREK